MYARRQAEDCAAKKQLYHGHDSTLSGPDGQNVYGPAQFVMYEEEDTVSKVVGTWYSQKDKYDQKSGNFAGCRYFTQLLWVGTTSVGMALSRNGLFCVANYFPQGNTRVDKFVINVRRPYTEQPPWEVRLIPKELPREDELAPCRAANWQRHEQLEQDLAARKKRDKIIASVFGVAR